MTACFKDLVSQFGETRFKDGELTRVDRIGGNWRLELLHLDRMQELPTYHTFGQALTALIEITALGELCEALAFFPSDLQSKSRIRVELITPRFSASIKFRLQGHLNYQELHRYEMLPVGTSEWAKDQKAYAGDLQQHRVFTHKTINAVGKLISQS